MGDLGWVDGGGGVEADLRDIAEEEGKIAEGGWAEGHGHLDVDSLEELPKSLLLTRLNA